MRMIILAVIFAVVLSYLGLCLEAYGNTPLEETNMRYGISIMTDKINYSIGEPIIMTLKIFNYTQEDIVFRFNTSQRYDFIIEDDEGNEIRHWSKNRMFAMVLGEEIIGPHNPEVIYTAEYNDRLSPGYYKVTGVFIAKDRPMSGSIIIEVK
jgi:hypothetical protein